MPGRRHNWAEIRTVFVHGIPDGDQIRWPTLNDTAEQAGISPSLLRARAAKERWVDARAEVQREWERARVAARAQQFLTVSSRVDERSLTIAEMGLQLVHARVQELAHVQGQRLQDVQAGRPVPPTDISLELTRLGLAGVRWHQLAMRATGQEAERAGALGPAPGDPTDAGVSDHERRLAEQVAERVALTVASVDVSGGPSQG